MVNQKFVSQEAMDRIEFKMEMVKKFRESFNVDGQKASDIFNFWIKKNGIDQIENKNEKVDEAVDTDILKFSIGMNVKIDYGEGALTFRKGEKLESISLDVGRESTKVALTRLYNDEFNVNIIELKGSSFKQFAVAILDLIVMFKPSTVYIGKNGFDLAVRDWLTSISDSKGIRILENGRVEYNTY